MSKLRDDLGMEPDHTGLDMRWGEGWICIPRMVGSQEGLEQGVAEPTYLLKDGPLAAGGLERAVGWEAIAGRNQEEGIRKQPATQVREVDVSEQGGNYSWVNSVTLSLMNP